MSKKTPQTELKDLNDGAKAAIESGLNGAGMKKLTLQRKSSYIDLQNSGRLKPATVINFNPIALRLHDGNVPFPVPSVLDKLRKAIEIKHGGRDYTASFVTLRDPKFVGWPRDVKKPADGDENPTTEFDPVWILPVELVDQFRIEYTDPSRTPMGGLVVYEGDIHAFTNKNTKTIRIPKFTVLPDRRRSYFTEEVNKEQYLSSMLDMQKAYCQYAIQQADGYFQDEDQARNVTDVHRAWAQFAIDMGWKQVAPLWMNATLDSESACKGCGKGKTRGDAHFCTCGRPYNPFASFMLGENVPESYLFALKEPELSQALKELARRKDLIAKFAAKQ